MKNLNEKLNVATSKGEIFLDSLPDYIETNLNSKFKIRPYQREAFTRFLYYINENLQEVFPKQLLFHMATGSGKTLIMAGCILTLYKQGYNNFIFFVNSNTIIQKTKDNFLNKSSNKYLFSDRISFGEETIKIKGVDTFTGLETSCINIVFTTIQGLHSQLNTPKENSLTYEDFNDKKVVLISDEAHHINAETKNGKLSNDEKGSVLSWEKTVSKIFNSNADNFLLEFTATADLNNDFIAAKYKDKLIFDYNLKKFRLDKYSKDVESLQADMESIERSIQAIVLSQYRMKIFEKNGVYIKPVILFKSKTISDSQQFYNEFINRIKCLSASDLIEIKNRTNNEIISKAFDYFENNNVELDNLVSELKVDFAENRCISVDSKSDTEEKQLIINSLEDVENEYRAVFAVDKLNEGWDVLNLFDIVRLYNPKDTNNKTTMAEAQLIGRGARYCPFKIEESQDLYRRKYDNEGKDEPLRIGEVLYYHSAYNPKYISELNKALEKTGIKDSNSKGVNLKPKNDFKELDFFINGDIQVNKSIAYYQLKIDRLDESIKKKERKFPISSGFSTISSLFDFELKEQESINQKVYLFGDLPIHIKRKAINKLKFYQFKNLQKYFPHLESINEFITSDSYINNIKILFIGDNSQVSNLTPSIILKACVKILEEVSLEMQKKETL